tara:strand:+ start:211238 stop:212158 length:921 start_codon:yes stop_codon:yes gene_type:complete
MNVAQAQLLQAADDAGAQLICLGDPGYPALLSAIPDPPPHLYVRGDASVLQQPQIAIVGSRKASPAGLRAADNLVRELVEAGLHICSGLALGVDAAAHRAALQAGGKSIAVMACGIDRIYPARHQGLARQLENAGCVITEFPPGTPPARRHFPQRNRLISGLSLGVLVVEAALPSGTLITAATATAQGREVFALPWSIFHEGGRGCLYLIKDGAKMVLAVEDILEELGSLFRLQQESMAVCPSPEAVQHSLRPALQALMTLVGFEVTTLEAITEASGLPIGQVLAGLSELELTGSVNQCPGGYIRC